jgi:hypothetical protein
MSYEGNVADLDLVGRLVDLSRERFTGAMRFENEGIIKIIYFKEGDILSASTNDRTDSIDEMLLRAGKITREHLKQALGKRKDNETLGDALLSLGFITRKELTWARRVQVLGIIRSVLAWNAGNYAVVSDYLPKREEGTIFPLPQIVIELIVTESDRGRFERLLDSGNATFEREPDFNGRFAQLGLNQDAEEIAAQIDGARSAAEVAAVTGKDAFNVYKLLHALELLGMLRRVDRSPRPAPAPAPRPAEAEGAPAIAALETAIASQPVRPAELWTAETWNEAPASYLDPIERSENAPSASTLPSTTLPLELGGVDVDHASSDSEPLHDPLDPDTVRSQVEENLGGDRFREGQPPRRGGMGPLVALLLLAILGGAGYFYWRSQHDGETTTSATSVAPPSVRPAIVRPLPATTVAKPAAAPGAREPGGTPSSGPVDTPSGLTVTRPTPSAATTSMVPPAPSPDGAARSVTTSAHRPDRTRPGARKIDSSRSAAREAVQQAAGGSNGAASETAREERAGATQFEPATATSRARITNVGQSASGRKAAVPASPKYAEATVPPVAAGNDPSRTRYDAMADRYARSVPAGEPYTVQVELVCRTESITRALAAGGEDVWFVPTSFRGERCYRVFWRHFRSAAAARGAFATVPASLAAGSTPTVARLP